MIYHLNISRYTSRLLTASCFVILIAFSDLMAWTHELLPRSWSLRNLLGFMDPDGYIYTKVISSYATPDESRPRCGQYNIILDLRLVVLGALFLKNILCISFPYHCPWICDSNDFNFKVSRVQNTNDLLTIFAVLSYSLNTILQHATFLACAGSPEVVLAAGQNIKNHWKANVHDLNWGIYFYCYCWLITFTASMCFD